MWTKELQFCKVRGFEMEDVQRNKQWTCADWGRASHIRTCCVWPQHGRVVVTRSLKLTLPGSLPPQRLLPKHYNYILRSKNKKIKKRRRKNNSEKRMMLKKRKKIWFEIISYIASSELFWIRISKRFLVSWKYISSKSNGLDSNKTLTTQIWNWVLLRWI